MKTPLLFKLLLLLALAFRLLKAAKKGRSIPRPAYYRLTASAAEPEVFSLKNPPNPPEDLKYLYRTYVRDIFKDNVSGWESLDESRQLLAVGMHFYRQFQRGGIYRFLWHGNNWLIAFGQSLKNLGMTQAGDAYLTLLSEISERPITAQDLATADWESIQPFPDGSKDYPSLQAFTEQFSPETYLETLISRTARYE